MSLEKKNKLVYRSLESFINSLKPEYVPLLKHYISIPRKNFPNEDREYISYVNKAQQEFGDDYIIVMNLFDNFRINNKYDYEFLRKRLQKKLYH